jgi:sortase A
MRKFSYLLILCGIVLLLYPRANEWYNDWQQDQLLKGVEQNYKETADSPVDTELKNRYAEVTQLLADESALDEQVQSESESPAAEPAMDDKVLAILEIDTIDLKLPVLEGANKANMKHAAAHMKETTPIGEIGNAAIAAHRARTAGRLFNRLNEVAIGDIITVTTKNQVYKYEVYDTSIVKPTDVSVLSSNDTDKILTLITCDPLVNPTHRLIVHAKLP